MSRCSKEDPWSCLRSDVARYGGWGAFFREQSLWAIAWYRIGRRLTQVQARAIRSPLLAIWWFAFRFIELLTGISLPLGARIGGGLRIWHFGGIFLNSNAVLGEQCTLRQGVTIGNRNRAEDAPTIGNRVDIGAYAQLLGPITVGDDAQIGAMALVISDVPQAHVAVGIPAISKPRAAAPLAPKLND